jgi:hypothetical protein
VVNIGLDLKIISPVTGQYSVQAVDWLRPL